MLKIQNDAEFVKLSHRIASIELSSRGNFWQFCQQAWHIVEPGTQLIWNWHLNALAAYLEAYAYRDINRLIINIPPGSMKSLMVSVFMPAWTWTWEPTRRYINITNETGLATRDSRRMRDLITSEWYQSRWGDRVALAHDQSEKANFENTGKGFRIGLGITSSISGKRGTDLILDDPIDTKKAFSDIENQTVNDAYDQAISSRLNDLDKDGICLIQQRTRTNDLTGHLLSKISQKWTHMVVRMESDGLAGYDPGQDIGISEYGDTRYNNGDLRDIRKHGDLMFPQRFSAKTVASLKEDLGEYGTAGQLNQRPLPVAGGIIKREYWSIWPDDMPLPGREHLFISWDTAYSERDAKNNAYSAVTIWGVFYHEQKQRHCLMVVGRWYDQVGYPVLRKRAQEFTLKYKPDAHLIEKKASGHSLIQDLRNTGSGANKVRLRSYTPDRDKVSRAHTATAVMAAGLVFVPNKPWAHELIDFCATFPNGQPPSADLVDTVTQAIIYLKKGWWISHPDDDDAVNTMPEIDYDEADDNESNRNEGLYG